MRSQVPGARAAARPHLEEDALVGSRELLRLGAVVVDDRGDGAVLVEVQEETGIARVDCVVVEAARQPRLAVSERASAKCAHLNSSRLPTLCERNCAVHAGSTAVSEGPITRVPMPNEFMKRLRPMKSAASCRQHSPCLSACEAPRSPTRHRSSGQARCRSATRPWRAPDHCASLRRAARRARAWTHVAVAVGEGVLNHRRDFATRGKCRQHLRAPRRNR
jgi:hypothetical protein